MGRHARKVPPLGIVIDADAGGALHAQIGRQLRRAILERRLTPGARLPSSRLLAAELNCARGTVLAAIDQLIAEGYLVTRAASATFVAADLPDEMLVAPPVRRGPDAPRPPDPVLPRRARGLLAAPRPATTAGAPPTAFPIGEPDRAAFPFAHWARLLEREWRRPGWDVTTAAHPFGHPGLRQAIAAYLGAARGFSCEPADIVVTSGVRQGVSLFARVVLDPGDVAWIEEPGYPGVRSALTDAGVDAAPVPIDAAGFSPDAALAAAPEARLAVVAPSHQFPLGTVMSLQRRLALLSWAERAQGWIVEDDFDGEYRYFGRPLAPLRALDRTGRVAYLGSFSKLLFPTLRLSFLVLPASLVEAAELTLTAHMTPAPMLGQGALARFIADGELAAHLRRTRHLYAIRQQRLVAAAEQHLAGLLLAPPDPGGMHLVARPHPDLAPGFDDLAATAAAAAHGVRVSPLSALHVRAPKTHGLLLGYAATPEDEIEPAVIRLRRALAGL
jgi:GntR family transcriptional regulator/MocR family aminotransferase